MTPKQEATEKASIEAFVKKKVHEIRPRGTNAAVTLVLLAAAEAAANASTRKRTGAIDRDEATKIFRAAAQLMKGL